MTADRAVCDRSARTGMDVELERSFEQEAPVPHGRLTFGGFSTRVPPAGDGKDGHSVRVVEKIVPAGGTLFVLGAVADSGIGKTGGVWGSLVASRRGRDGLIGSTKRNATIRVAPSRRWASCLALRSPRSPTRRRTRRRCSRRAPSSTKRAAAGLVHGNDLRRPLGSDVAFKVTQAGTFRFLAGSPGQKTTMALLASIRVEDQDGHPLAPSALSELGLDLEARHVHRERQRRVPRRGEERQTRDALRALRRPHRVRDSGTRGDAARPRRADRRVPVRRQGAASEEGQSREGRYAGGAAKLAVKRGSSRI